MKTNKRLERYYGFLENIYQYKQFIPSKFIYIHEVSKNVTRALLELELIKKVPNKRDHIYIGKKPTKQMAQMLIDQVNMFYKKSDFIKKISDYKECVTMNENDKLVFCDKLNDWKVDKDVNIINETKEQPFLLFFTWIYNKKIMFLFKEKITNKNMQLVYATDYNHACNKLKLNYKHIEITEIVDLTIR